MNMTCRNHRSSVAFFILLSLMAHGVTAYTLVYFGLYDVTRPLRPEPIVSVDIGQPEQKSLSPEAAHSVEAKSRSQAGLPLIASEVQTDDPGRAGGRKGTRFTASGTDTPLVGATVSSHQETAFAPAGREGAHQQRISEEPAARPAIVMNYPLILKTGDLLRAKREKLSYLITLYGIPVGNATLEAKNAGGELRITATAHSNDVISTLYPVDNWAETRVMAGNYILTRIRQQEGTYRSDIGFTICLPQRNVFWINRLSKGVANYAIESNDVMDVITGFYSLRTRDLAVGSTVVLHLFDSNEFAATSVHVVRRERVVLPGFRTMETLVIKPELQTEGLFRKRGELLIWLTDDEFKVPVRLETTIALGKVTAELVSAESEQ